MIKKLPKGELFNANDELSDKLYDTFMNWWDKNSVSKDVLSDSFIYSLARALEAHDILGVNESTIKKVKK